jgi:hypothetical protein
MQPNFEAHIRSRFAATPLTLDPFPHLVIHDLLPTELYTEMYKDLPTERQAHRSVSRLAWVRPRALLGLPIPRMVRTGEQPMFGLRPGNGTTKFLDPYASRWQRKYQDYIDLVDRLTIEAYGPAISAYMGQLQRAGLLPEPQAPVLGQALFTHRTEEWRIGPHTHDANQLIQSMIYFPLPGSNQYQGTVLYRLKKPKTLPAAELMQTCMYAEDEVEEAGQMKYHPNTLASFLNTPLAIHASPDVPGPSRRYTFTAAVVSGVSAPDRKIDLIAEFGDPGLTTVAAE